MISPADAQRLTEHLADLRRLRARISDNRPDAVEADDAIDEAIASLDSAASNLRYALIVVEDTLGEQDSIEAGDLIATLWGPIVARPERYP